MRIDQAMEAIGPLVETIAAIGVGLALFYVYFTQLSAARFIALNIGNFSPLRADQNVQPHPDHHGALDPGDDRHLRDPRLEANRNDAPDAIELPSATGRIDLENVTFKYAGGVTSAVSDLSLRIEPGKTYALVGASGAGKSTILSLLLRLYDPESGSVRIDGHDLRSVTQKSLRHRSVWSRRRRSCFTTPSSATSSSAA